MLYEMVMAACVWRQTADGGRRQAHHRAAIAARVQPSIATIENIHSMTKTPDALQTAEKMVIVSAAGNRNGPHRRW
jgi:hypothetical protein